jgi:hypothetical protein
MSGYNIYTDPRVRPFLPPRTPKPITKGLISHLDPTATLTKLMGPAVQDPNPGIHITRQNYNPGAGAPYAKWMSKPSKFNTGISRTIGQNNPIAEYQRVMNQMVMTGVDRKAQYMNNQFAQSQQDWKAALLDHPDLDYRDFLKTYMNNPLADYLALSPGQRGLNNASRVAVVRPG